MARVRVVSRSRPTNHQPHRTNSLHRRTPLSERARRLVARNASQAERERIERLREAYSPYNPSPQERERLRRVRRQNEREDRRRARQDLLRNQSRFQEAMFRFWNWRYSLDQEEFDIFLENEVFPPYFRSVFDFLTLERNGIDLRLMTGALEDGIVRAERVSWLLTHPYEMYRSENPDFLRRTARNYRESIIPRTNIVESSSESESDSSIEDYFEESGFEIEEAW